MTITPATFIQAFPEFENTSQYPPLGISFWITQAYNQLNAWRFGTSLDLAASLFVAHNMVLGAQASATAATPTGIVGQASGPLASKTVGPVSGTFDTAAVATEGAGIWNQTQYGQRLWKMMQTYCSGPAYVPGRRRYGCGYGYGFGGFGRGYGW